MPLGLSHLQPGEGAGRRGLGPYELLGAALDRLVETGGLPPALRPGAEYPAWAAVHGLSNLLIDGPLRDLTGAERDEVLEKVFTVVLEGL